MESEQALKALGLKRADVVPLPPGQTCPHCGREFRYCTGAQPDLSLCFHCLGIIDWNRGGGLIALPDAELSGFTEKTRARINVMRQEARCAKLNYREVSS